MIRQMMSFALATVLACGVGLELRADEGTSKPDGKELVIADGGKTSAIIVVSPDAGKEERLAAQDLAKYIGLMSEATPDLVDTPDAIAAALKSAGPVLIVGQEAIKADGTLSAALKDAVTRKTILRSDAIVLRRKGNRVYLAGSNDASHYYAVAELLRLWGCRWYVPTEFGECIPNRERLTLGTLDHAYSPPFEIRTYWVSWMGDSAGKEDFQRRNLMTVGRAGMPPTGHAIGKYVKDLSDDVFKLPLTDPKTADHVGRKVDGMYASGKSFSLGMEDGSYDSPYPKDRELMKLQWDKYFMRWSVTDPFLELYNNVARILRKKHPESGAKIGFLAYANMTIPPVRDMKAERSLFCDLAPIDIDPIHGMDSKQSPPRREYRAFLHKWAKVMDGRVCIYDYDQGMLVWRDIPNPSHQAFAQDVKHYRDAGILGVNTESRNSIATIFLNLYFRGRLLWNPDDDVPALLHEFYGKFYGPAAKPMSRYWGAIYKAWEETLVTEHEHFVAPAIYTPELLGVMKTEIGIAEAAVAPLRKKAAPTRNEKLYLDRVAFTRLSFDITEAYLGMVRAAATDMDYGRAVELGVKGMAIRKRLLKMNGTFVTIYGPAENRGYAWWPGEVKQYRELLPFVNGEKGTLIAKLPLRWAFRRDVKKVGEKEGFASGALDLSYWNANRARYDLDSRKDYPEGQWEMLRTDLYMQAQGIRHPDRQSYVGHAWYRTDVDIPEGKEQGNPHLRFPGLFCECRLYINGKEIAHRKQGNLWWMNDYRFEWDIDLTGKLKPGKNTIAVWVNCEHHFGGMFRRPFIYAAQ